MEKKMKNVTPDANDTQETAPAQNTAVAVRDEDTGIQGKLLSTSDAYCSFVPKTDADRAMLFNAMNSPEFAIKDFINIPISMRYLYMEVVTMVDEKTGEITTANRVVIIDENLKGYSCVSTGVFSALKKLCSPQMFGDPSGWKAPIKVIPKNIAKAANRNILTLVLAPM